MKVKATCIKCGQELSPGVGFCASCGFDNESMARAGERATIDERIEERIAWLQWSLFFDRWFWWLRR